MTVLESRTPTCAHPLCHRPGTWTYDVRTLQHAILCANHGSGGGEG